MSNSRITYHTLAHIKPGDLIIGKYHIFDKDMGIMIYTAYGTVVDINISSKMIDIQLPQFVTISSDINKPSTKAGCQLSDTLKGLMPYCKHQQIIMSINISDVIRHYKMAPVSPVDISIKVYLQLVFSYYIPRYISHVHEPKYVHHYLHPIVKIEGDKYSFHYYQDNNKEPGGISVCHGYRAYTKNKIVREAVDPYKNTPIMLHQNNYGAIDFNNHKDLLPLTTSQKMEMAPYNNSLVFGHPQESDKGVYFSEWVYGSMSMLLFYTLLMYDDHPSFYKKISTSSSDDSDEDGRNSPTTTMVKLTKEELLQKLTVLPINGNRDQLYPISGQNRFYSNEQLENYWTKNNLYYSQEIPSDMWVFLYLVMEYERPENIPVEFMQKFTSNYVEIINSVFQFITKK